MSKQTYLCYNCNHANCITEAFCKNCNIVQPPLKLDHFTRLKQKTTYSLDLEQLESAYLSLQKLLHPDLFGQKNQIEQNFAFKHSLLINQAYETLKNPLKRSEYLLGLENIQVNNNHPDAIKADTDLLDDIFELQTNLEEIETKQDKEKFYNDIKMQIAEIHQELDINYNQRNFKIMANLTLKLNYLEKIKNNNL